MYQLDKLPHYGDDEVQVFHPICEHALNAALKNAGLDNEYEVKHHETIGSIEADFVIKRKSNGKYILFVEVKRTPTAVTSTRYRLQTQSYVQEARSSVELPYYAITNLEVLDLFKYDANRPSVNQQIIEPSPVRIGTFVDDPNEFFEKLVDAFEQIIEIVINDQGTYKELTGSFVPMLEENKNDSTKWHQSLIVAGYEYIRGVLRANNRKVAWKEAFSYRNRPNKLISNIQSIDFETLTKPPHPVSRNQQIWNTVMLEDLAELGHKSINGDELAEIIHSVVISGREHEGLVPTDLELANILAILARQALGRELREDEMISDPAAGGGNLLVSSLSGFQNISPKQLWANDKESLFSELLSIRLGLLFPKVVSPSDSPKVTEKDVIELEKSEFEDVKVVLMNPPYVSGVKDPETKKNVAARIYDVEGRKSRTNVGQVGIEAPFLELVTSLVEDGTVIGVVFPKQYLTTKGKEASAFRKFLLNDFGLHTIFMYPREGIFKEVVKDTVVLIGRKNMKQEHKTIIKSDIPLANINLGRMKMGLNETMDESSISNIAYGLNMRKVSHEELEEGIEAGWKNLTTTGSTLEKWVEETLESKYISLKSIFDLRRGRIGNAGASELLFINTNNKLWDKVKDDVPEAWLFPALKRVNDIDAYILNSTTTEVRFLAPPDQAFEEGTLEYELLENIIDHYLVEQSESRKNTKQRKKLKTKEELRKILNRERKKVTKEYTILIPRNIRRNARAFITTEQSYVSTNVIEVTGGSMEEKWITLSWLQSVFSQLQFEGMAKDQEGTRKLEKGSIEELLVPEFELINDEAKSELTTVAQNRNEFLDLCNPQRYDVDTIWASILDISEEELEETIELLADRVAERYPEFSNVAEIED